MKSKKEIIQEIYEAENATAFNKLLTDLNQWLEKEPDDAVLLEQRALLYEKLQQYSKAINDYKKILEVNPSHKQAATKIEMISTILRIANTDIYASPNTNLDPWME